MSNSSGKHSWLGVTGVVQIVFIVLKLCNLINWSWWLVFIPLWIDLAECAVLLFILLIIKLYQPMK